MALYTITRRILGSILIPFRPLYNSSGPVRMFKDIRSVKCNAFVRIRRQSVIRFRKGSCRQMTESYHTRIEPPKGIYFHMKPVPAMMCQYMCRFDRRFTAPIAKYSGFPGLEKKKFYPMESPWKLYAQSKEPSNPERRKDGTISGVSIKKLNAASTARINKVKQMLKEKSMLKGDCRNKRPK